MAAATSESDEEGSVDDESAVESAVTHNNPFAALNNGEDSMAAQPVAEVTSLDSSSEHSASTSAGFEPQANGSASKYSPKPHRHRHERAELDLAGQRQAVLARIRASDAGMHHFHTYSSVCYKWPGLQIICLSHFLLPLCEVNKIQKQSC